MSFLGAVGNLGSAVVNTCLLPVDFVVEIATIGCDDTESPSARRLDKIIEDASNAYEETW